ncbi:bacteriohemerythrin [Novispirillum sp. DQ9]|uniref:bacteriohemerythrin n=1 Tax=Novispirillum sp. DQ9 TaxID=3398612 RepID=UPI003C7DB6E3
MSRIEWTPDLAVGRDDIDADHRALFALFHRLETADLSDGLVAEIIGRLEDYARHHFAREEEMLRQVNYPDYDEHVKGHRLFIEWLDAVKRSYTRTVETPFEIGETVNHFLGEWLLHHVREEDMRYRDLVRGGTAEGS